MTRARRSEHAEAFTVSDGFDEAFTQLVSGAVVGQQQHVEARVRRRQPTSAVINSQSRVLDVIF